jgi:hypothetical protein
MVIFDPFMSRRIIIPTKHNINNRVRNICNPRGERVSAELLTHNELICIVVRSQCITTV